MLENIIIGGSQIEEIEIFTDLFSLREGLNLSIDNEPKVKTIFLKTFGYYNNPRLSMIIEMKIRNLI